MKGLAGKTAVVTGSSRGIGRAIALDLAKNGVVVAMMASKPSRRAKNSLKIIQKHSSGSKLFFSRIENRVEVEALVRKIKINFGRVDFLINNAGINHDKTLVKMTYFDWDEVINVNLTGTFNMIKNVLPIVNKNGRIINISSIVGIGGAYGQVNYAASKAGIIGLTKSLAKELAKQKITVNAICPGYTKTDMLKTIPNKILIERLLPQIPLRRLAEPSEIASIVTFLCSKNASYITGEILPVDGGLL